MALSVFDDKATCPNDHKIATALGRTAPLWTALKDALHTEYDGLEEDWHSAGAAHGWSLRLKQKTRAIVYLTPCAKHFLASFALGEKACRAALAAGLDPSVLALIDAAPRYAEGRGVRIPVRKRGDVDQVLRVARVKMAR
jgi:hypothetical protein